MVDGLLHGGPDGGFVGDIELDEEGFAASGFDGADG